MTKQFKLMALASAVLLLGACAEETVLNPEQAREANPESNAIAFSTYMGKSTVTRAGATGSIDTDKLKEADYGFGVFAYYTGNDSYGKYQGAKYATDGGAGAANHEANFMFNQKVYWDAANTAGYITHWYYTPVKYWPNEVKNAANHDVDDQNKDTSNDPALGSNENGGNVSFFAYAPYVDFETTEPQGLGATNGTASGIIAINGATALATANAVEYDPTVTYKLPASSTVKAVDLLWGTAGINGTGVAGAENLGQKGDNTDGNDWTTHAANAVYMKNAENTYTFDTYAKSILKDFRTNADLTKQTTGGTIQIAFKHALAKIGGSYTKTGSDEGDDDDATTPTHGLMVILDLDDFKGGEFGGQLEDYKGAPASTFPEWNKYNTKVTINEIEVKCDKELADGVTEAYLKDINKTITDWSQYLVNQGVFNLATGQWSNVTRGAVNYSQTIEQSSVNPGTSGYGESNTDQAKDAIISEELAEPSSVAHTKAGYESIPIGVTTVAKNVYENEANPLVFIPGTRPIIEFTITYTVRTYDPNLNGVFTEVKQKIKKNLYILNPVELNKQYNILMHLGLTSVKFDATVSNWDVTDLNQGVDSEGNPNPISVETFTEDVDHVYLPINVGEPQSVAAQGMTANTNADLNTSTKAFTVGSAGTYIATFTGMKATFEDGPKDVELSHVTVVAVDKDNNPVDWVTYNYTPGGTPEIGTGTLAVTANESVDNREAKIRIIYDNVAEEYTITQYGRVVQASPVLHIYSDAGKTTEITDMSATPLASGVTKYYTKVTYTYQESTKAGVGNGTDVSGQTTETGYTLTAGDYTTVNGTTFSTKQYVTTVYNPTDRTEGSTPSTNKLKLTFDDVNVDVPITQAAPVVNDIDFTIDGSTAPAYNASATATGAIKVVAKFKDSNNKAAGEVTVPNTALVGAANANAWAIIEETDWTSYTPGQDKIALVANTGPSAVDRNAVITVNYNNSATTKTVTVTQRKP